MSVLAAFHWTVPFIGIPFVEFGRTRSGCDCWGLVRLVYQEELGIDLPDYLGRYASAEERVELQALIAEGKATGPWRPADVHDVRPQPFDVMVYRRGRLDSHLGLFVEPGVMLHVAAEEHAKLERFSTGQWLNRLSGIYRHEACL